MIYVGSNKINKIGNGNKIYLGNMLIYQSVVDEWVDLTFDFDKTKPFQEIRIDMNNVSDDSKAYCFARLSVTPNGSYSNSYFSICPAENTISDDYKKIYINTLENLGNNVYYYKFSRPVYVANIEKNFNVSRIKIKI